MIELTRTVRFGLDGDDGVNAYAGRPRVHALGPWHELDVTVRGVPDPQTGYLVDIKTIDRAVRAHAVGLIRGALESGERAPSRVLRAMVPALAAALPVELAGLRWRLTPYYGVAMSASDQTTVSISQRFDFAAAHRLHVDALSDERNRELFGKCNNPSGHGHNYRIEPLIDVDLDERGVASFGLGDLERLTDALVVQRFDHKHLNLDTDEFGPGGLNPSVENIARVSYELLREPIADAGARLRRVTVWETDRTCATYPAE